MAKKIAGRAGHGEVAVRLGMAGRAISGRAAAIKTALEALRDGRGRITPESVVRVAKNPKHVLHREFGWDDRQQANLRRLDRARELITQYVTVTVVYKSERVTAPYYVRDPTAPPATQGYVALVGDAMTRENAATVVLAEFSRCESSISRARRIAHVLDGKFPGLSDQLEELLIRLIEVKAMITKAA
jgi:hypothetical protein